MTNKRIGLFALLTGLFAIAGAFIAGYLNVEQASILITPLVIGCVTLMGLDAFYDFLGIVFRIGEQVTALTPSPEDDKRLADLKALVEQLKTDVDDKAIGGMVMHWLDMNWKDIPEIFLPRNELDKTAAPNDIAIGTTRIEGTTVSFFTPDDKANG